MVTPACSQISSTEVATKPWREAEVEKALVGQKPSAELFAGAAAGAVKLAAPRKYNGYKVELCQRTIVRALETVAAMG